MTLELNAKETALVLIDLEHGIVGRQLAPYSGADVVGRAAKLAEAVRDAGGTVVYVHVLLNEVLRLPADKEAPRSADPIPAEASELVPESGYQPGTDILITKRQWTAFYGTNLDQALRRKGIKTVIMAGIATNIGVESTARDAQARGYALVFAEDAMSSVSKEMHQFAIHNIFPMIGKVRSSEEVKEALRDGSHYGSVLS